MFGASRAVELARSDLFDPDQHNHFLSTLPFRKWNRAGRQLAPPLVVELEAEDLLPAGLGEFLDGVVKIVLVVKGPTTPAPLARLITPTPQLGDRIEVHALNVIGERLFFRLVGGAQIASRSRRIRSRRSRCVTSHASPPRAALAANVVSTIGTDAHAHAVCAFVRDQHRGCACARLYTKRASHNTPFRARNGNRARSAGIVTTPTTRSQSKRHNEANK